MEVLRDCFFFRLFLLDRVYYVISNVILRMLKSS